MKIFHNFFVDAAEILSFWGEMGTYSSGKWRKNRKMRRYSWERVETKMRNFWCIFKRVSACFDHSSAKSRNFWLSKAVLETARGAAHGSVFGGGRTRTCGLGTWKRKVSVLSSVLEFSFVKDSDSFWGARLRARAVLGLPKQWFFRGFRVFSLFSVVACTIL